MSNESNSVCPVCGIGLIKDADGFTYAHMLFDTCEPRGGDE